MANQNVMFSPRRLGHANLFVGELERSSEFYTNVCGLTEVFREPPIKAIFLSNGSSHHDVALIEVSRKARKAGDGSSLISEKRGMTPGLNHFGWEMENEAVLLEAYERALESGLPIHRTADHQVSHSVYLFDPEGNYHEFYADAAKDWREVWQHGNTEVLTVKWTPDNAERSTDPHYAVDPELTPQPGAIIPSRQVGYGVIVAEDYRGPGRLLQGRGGAGGGAFGGRRLLHRIHRPPRQTRPRDYSPYRGPYPRHAPRRL